jgi:hypothetical protein
MATVPHQPAALPERQRWYRRFLVPEMWASLAIIVMWLAVLLDALFGPDFVSASGTSMTRIPSAIILALFAYLGTRAVAKYGFGHRPDPDG